MSGFPPTPATEHSDFAPGPSSVTPLPTSDGIRCTSHPGGEEEILPHTVTQQMHVDLVQCVRDLEAARQEKEAAVKVATERIERMEREGKEMDETTQRNMDYLREFWNEARLGRKVEADRAFLLDANLTKKTDECEGLTARIAIMKRALACANQDNVKLRQNEAKVKKEHEEKTREIDTLKKKLSLQNAMIGLHVLVLGVIVARRCL
ncbi:hypothetical protein HYPSUDRAFT_59905 [Hypholoma sublateritium FD-334 SS-4]|uniref:Uncharacterized protein n=1 Tax=Hypholoma sublateritium (strain FD-334 SS-4) TaxID=945553 RepID=A0A0D2N2D8_HYPSF|nr:hypothetical protein HYPSUDRAFT_59905 [Hypholoma sublateritium FD-334 SS-4]